MLFPEVFLKIQNVLATPNTDTSMVYLPTFNQKNQPNVTGKLLATDFIHSWLMALWISRLTFEYRGGNTGMALRLKGKGRRYQGISHGLGKSGFKKYIKL